MSAMILIIAGLILTLGGVGGIEHSINNADLITSSCLAVLGLLSMFAGSHMIRTKSL